MTAIMLETNRYFMNHLSKQKEIITVNLKTSLDFFYIKMVNIIYIIKTEIFEGLFSVPSLFKEEKQEYETLEFTPITLAFNGDWREVSSVLTDALAKKFM